MVLLFGGFGLLIWATFGDIPFINSGVSISEDWTIYGAISLPLTFLMFLINENEKNTKDKKLIKERLITTVEQFLSEIFVTTENLYAVISELSSNDIHSLEVNSDLHKLFSSLYTLKVFSGFDPTPRRNYIMRLKLNTIFVALMPFCKSFKKVVFQITPIKLNEVTDAEVTNENIAIWNQQEIYLKAFESDNNQISILRHLRKELDKVL
jgi:hypothetical protein